MSETDESHKNGTPSASNRGRIDPFIVMDVISRAARRAAEGADIVHMEVGQPATPAPEAARRAVKKVLDTAPLGYTEALGMPALRDRIARYYKEVYDADVAAEQVVVTTGSSAGFVLAFLALFDAGARIALASPGYPCYRQILKVLGLEAVVMETGPAERWMPTVSQVETAITAGGAKGVLIASPANPTGAMIKPGDIRGLVTVCQRHGVWFVSDEIYHGLTYSWPGETALQCGVNTVVINSFSKYFSMTGWRVGWMIVPLEHIRTVERIAQNLFISAPTVSQVAALAAFEGIDELEGNKRRYMDNRSLLIDGLRRTGLDEIVPADGAFYLYADIMRFADDSLEFAQSMLDEIGVAVTPGVDFDPARGARYLRFSYAGSTEQVKEGIRRMVAWRKFGGLR